MRSFERMKEVIRDSFFFFWNRNSLANEKCNRTTQIELRDKSQVSNENSFQYKKEKENVIEVPTGLIKYARLGRLSIFIWYLSNKGINMTMLD